MESEGISRWKIFKKGDIRSMYVLETNLIMLADLSHIPGSLVSQFTTHIMLYVFRNEVVRF